MPRVTVRPPHWLRIPRVRGHRIEPEARASADWVRSALFVMWALGFGLFLIINGNSTFQRESYQALRETFPCTPVVGGTLLAAGIIGVAGTWAGVRWLTKAFYIIAAIWHGLYFGYTVPANLGLFGNTNSVSLFALLVGLLYAVELIEIRSTPTPKVVEP